jgi:hypothetical protein
MKRLTFVAIAALSISTRADAQQLPAGDLRVASAAGMFYSSELANPLGGPALWTRTGGTHGVFAAYAPNGLLDFGKVEAR